MILARIVGTVVATRKDPRLVSNKLLVARPVDPRGKPRRQLPRRRRHGRRRRRRNRADRQRQLRAHGVRHEGLPGGRRLVGIVDTIDISRVDAMQLATRHRRRRGHPQGRSLDGITLLVLQPLAADGAATPAGRWSRWIRSAPASASTCSSSAARKPAFPFHPIEVPADAGIVGIVDHWIDGSAAMR